MLAGGRGSRLGGTKPSAALAGRPLIDWALATVDEAGLDAIVVAKPGTALEGTGALEPAVEVLREPAQPVHPLLGVATALEHAGEPLVVCPCDLPLLGAAVLRLLARQPGAATVVVELASGMQPLLGRYSPAAAPGLRRAALAGRPARAAVASLGPALLSEEQLRGVADPETALRNVNTPEDLAAVEALLGLG